MATNLLVIICIMGWGIGAFLCAKANAVMHPIMVISIGSLLHILLTPILFILFKVDYTINTTGILYSILCGLMMGIGSVAYFFAMQKGSAAGEITFLCALYPGITILLSSFFIGESFSLRKTGGILCAILSFYLFTK